MAAGKKKKPSRTPTRTPAWTRLSDDALLDRRFSELRLNLRRSPIEAGLKKLQAELRARGIRFRPHVWLSEEWFSPDGVPGIAVPFYLAHPRLARMERHFMHEVEGGNENWLMRILRHEAGHAIDTAFRLRRRKEWKRIFGKPSRPYPDIYRPRPASKQFVLHLGHWYSQSHPTEDFAETFAVWLQPRAGWRKQYESWPALQKLEYIDRLMKEIRDEKPAVVSRDVVEPLYDDRRTLREHYRLKLARYELQKSDIHDRRLIRVFGRRDDYPRRQSAAGFLRQVRPQLTRLLARHSRLHPYFIHHIMRTVIQRCRELDLVLNRPQREAKREAAGLLERIIIDLLRRDRERFTL